MLYAVQLLSWQMSLLYCYQNNCGKESLLVTLQIQKNKKLFIRSFNS